MTHLPPLARARQLLALGILLAFAWDVAPTVSALWGGPYILDPAYVGLLVLALVGVGARCFWGRWLTICFMSAVVSLKVLWLVLRFEVEGLGWPDLAWWLHLAGELAVIGLLCGGSMRASYEGSPGRFNPWARTSALLGSLRWLALAQALVLAQLYALRPLARPLLATLILVAGLGLVGLAFHRTWGLLLLLLAALGELASVGLLIWLRLRVAPETAIFVIRPPILLILAQAAPALISLLMLTPYLRAMARHLRRAPHL